MLQPKSTRTVYKLFRTLKSRPGELFPLFIDKSKSTPIGTWVPALFVPTKGFAPRPGWHCAATCGDAEHLKRSDGTFDPRRVWAECQIPADIDWQPVADASPTRDIRDTVPEGGFYRFPRPEHQGGEWLIAGSLKVVRILTEAEMATIRNS